MEPLAKRQRCDSDTPHATDDHADADGPHLLALPYAILRHICTKLDARSLAQLEVTAPIFAARADGISRLPLTEDVARQVLIERCGSLEHAERWR